MNPDASLEVPKSSHGAIVGSIERPLHELFPRLRDEAPFAALAELPTPCEALCIDGVSDRVFVKRDDRSAGIYGGNKLRTLEALFGAARRAGFQRVVSTGAFGSNHAVATVLHAPRAGLASGVLLSPQPGSATALDNLRVAVHFSDKRVILPHWSCIPLGIWGWRWSEPGAYVMPPGGAVPKGALGYVSAALELAQQIARHALPAPDRIVLPVGSTCTTAGLLLGMLLVKRLGLGFERGVPKIHAVRVTPWPVTSVFRIVDLARRTALYLANATGRHELAFSKRELSQALHVDPGFLGAGYGRPLAAGRATARVLGQFGDTLDSTYSLKAAGALLEVARASDEVVLFWATKSSAPLPAVPNDWLHAQPSFVKRWVYALDAAARHPK
ncbi:MAG TPA: pyridoxal-phosphate dependent enzyme [Polyangiaceae bacterium]|nr:pyridoxal-phosphate dependent enzyme [Polyangiaceae bacterium]